jgi:DNA primase large subunit
LIITDEDYLKYLPFLSSSNVMKQVNITIDKIENTNTFNDILFDIYREINFLITNEIRIFPLENSFYEISKFYLTILLLKGIDNIAITRIWVKYFMKKIEVNMKAILTERKIRERKIDLFLDVFRLLEANEQFKLKRITIEGNIAFGIHMMKYLDIEDSLMDEVTTLHKGHVIIPTEETEFLIKLIQDFAQKKIFKLYEKAELDLTITKKIKFTTDKIKEDVINSQKVSINTKKHFVPKELLEEQERVKDVERANVIIKEIEENNNINIDSFPPCVVYILDNLMNKKRQLSHYENILLCTYLGKKHFDIEQVKKIFSKAVNYDPQVTRYQVEFLYKKRMMPSSCQNLATEGLCYADDICKKYKIKNPLVYRNDT